MLNLTNAEADHLARHAEKAADLLRELAAHHRVQQDAMHVIGERLMEWYHQGKAEIVLAVVAEVERDAADLRERRKPAVPKRPVGMPPAAVVTPKRHPLADHQRRQAIEEANRPR